jgi:hypothetical protein
MALWYSSRPMPTTYTCTFVIPSAPGTSNGAKLAGSGFGNKPVLKTGDTIQVQVQATGNSPPPTLNGYMIISPAQLQTNQSQTTPSPFVTPTLANFICFRMQQNVGASTAQGTTTYNFNALTFTYGGGYVGQYELTFVAEAPSLGGTQWSEDPEFDTGE